jgi:serine/threonine protein kinase
MGCKRHSQRGGRQPLKRRTPRKSKEGRPVTKKRQANRRSRRRRYYDSDYDDDDDYYYYRQRHIGPRRRRRRRTILKVNENVLRAISRQRREEREKREYDIGQRLSTVIGEGGFGCALRPNLPCLSGKNPLTDRMISKILPEEDAMKELAIVKRLDSGNDFTLPPPIFCKPKKTKETLKSIQKCHAGKMFEEKFNEMRILNSVYGGVNLAGFVNDMVIPYIEDRGGGLLGGLFMNNRGRSMTASTSPIPMTFWSEASFMFLGIKKMSDNKYLHFDLKPQNILVDPNKMRMNIIDFGLMKSKEKIADRMRNDRFDGFIHWSYPMDYFFLARPNFYRLRKLNAMDGVLEHLLLKLDNDPIHPLKNGNSGDNDDDDDDRDDVNDREQEDLFEKFRSASRTFFHYCDDSPGHIKRYQTDMQTFLRKLRVYDLEQDKSRLIQRFINSFDAYGLGFSFQYVLVKSKPLMEKYPKMYDELYECFYQMYTPDLFERFTIKKATEVYSRIINKYRTPFPAHRIPQSPLKAIDFDDENDLEFPDLSARKRQQEKEQAARGPPPPMPAAAAANLMPRTTATLDQLLQNLEIKDKPAMK